MLNKKYIYTQFISKMKEEYNIKDYNDEEMYKILNLESDVSDRV